MSSGSYNEFGAQTGTPGTLPGHGPIVVTTFSESLLDNSTLAEWQTDLGISAGTFQPIDAALTSISALVTAADKGIYTTALDTYATFDLTAFARTILDDADASAVRTTLGLVIGTDVLSPSGSGASLTSLNASQLTSGTVPNARLDAELSAIAGLTSAADQLPYFTGSGAAALATFTAFGRSLVDDADATAARATLVAPGLAAANTFSGINAFDNATAFNALVEINNSDLTVTGGGTISGDGGGLTNLNGGAVGSGVDSDNVVYTSTGTGSVERTLQVILDERPISVKDFGATGDGSTDDRAAILLALAAAYAQQRPLLFPAATVYYRITDEILLDKPGLRIIGVHDDATSRSRIHQATANKSVFRIIKETALSSNNFITFRDLYITGVGLGTSTAAGIHIDSDGSSFFDEICFEHVTVSGFNIGLLAERWSNSTVYQCQFLNNNWGFETANAGLCNTINVTNCWFGLNTNAGVKIGSANATMVFRSCEWQGETTYGKHIYLSGGSIAVEGGNFEGGTGNGSDGTANILVEVGTNCRLEIRNSIFLMAGGSTVIPIRASGSGSHVHIHNVSHTGFDASIPLLQAYRNVAPGMIVTGSILPMIQIYDTSAFSGTPSEFHSLPWPSYYNSDLPAAAIGYHGLPVTTIDRTGTEMTWIYLMKGGTITAVPLTPTQQANTWTAAQTFSATTTLAATTQTGQAVMSGTTPQINLRSVAGTDDGLYFWGSSASGGYLTGGVEWTGGWTARATTAEWLQLESGLTAFYNATGLTIGNSATPVERLRISTSLVINEPGNDYDFRVEGDTDVNLLFIDAGNDRVGIGTNAPGYKLDVNGTSNFTGSARFADNIVIATAGKGLQVKEGSNAKMGQATLTSGTVTVSTTAVTASSRIILTLAAKNASTAIGIPSVGTVTAATSFVINALKPADATVETGDASTINWMIVEPAP